MNFNNNEILILGMGNDILMDDGIGPKLVKELQQMYPFDKVKYDTACVGGMEILEYIQGYQKVILIDAIKTKGGIPGTVYEFTPDDFKETLHLSNLHDISFLTALKFGGKIGMQIPEEIKIIAVEIIEDMTFGDEFTPELKKKYPAIFNEVSAIIKKMIA
ncbi:MAG: hypothetical protein A2V66_08935 [Ignavibacteria bacterium RBG_13_36_8]|nr:MAG: hypothetical protein A2V66_08935 [Ignavibacteria bacterium RBG_13_36_8]